MLIRVPKPYLRLCQIYIFKLAFSIQGRLCDLHTYAREIEMRTEQKDEESGMLLKYSSHV
jgi:hypothetical protein